MTLVHFVDSVRSVAPRKLMRFTAAAGALVFGGLLAASPAAAAECKFASVRQINIDTCAEPQLLIDATCTEPCSDRPRAV